MASATLRPHALIIEDELISALALQGQLSDLGYRSFAFAGAERQALEQAQLQCPDLVTVDVGLLDGSGIDAVDAILQTCGPLPVVYVTGDGGALRGREGAVVVEKPVSAAALAHAVIRAKGRPQVAAQRTPASAPENRAVI